VADAFKFDISTIANQFTYQENGFTFILHLFVDLVVATPNPRRYAIGFANNHSGRITLHTFRGMAMVGLEVPPFDQIWLNIKDHAVLPYQQWVANGTTGFEVLMVYEIIQLP
jgi:hypothetical protein